MAKIINEMMNVPKVTIIMATFNRAHFIVETLVSIQNQTYQNWECLIVDDDGTDNTAEVIADILAQDSRFQFLKRPENYKKGLPGCRNYGIDLAKGEYIIFFDDDDIMHPKLLNLSLREIGKNNYDFCRFLREAFYENFDLEFDFDENYKFFEIDVSDIEKVITNKLRFNSCQVIWKKHCFKNERYHEDLMYAEEWEFYIRILSNQLKGISIEKILFFGRKHENSNTGDFFKGSTARIISKVEACNLILENLNEKHLLSYSIIRYFVQLSLIYKEFDLFERILNVLKLNRFNEIKWRIFYITLPIRLKILRFKKSKYL